MTTSTFFISKASARNLKKGAQRILPNVASSHMSEGVAVSLGFKSNAAFCASLKSASTVEAAKPNNQRLLSRLNELGYDKLPKDLKPLPELKYSHTPFRCYPLRSKFGPRWHMWRNLLVTGINAGIKQHQFGLSPHENWWPGATCEYTTCKSGTYHFMFDNQIPATVAVREVSGDELSILVLINPRKPVHPDSSFGEPDEADASAHGWLERRCGAWIQDSSVTLSCKRILQPCVLSTQVEPLGYSDQGSFFL